MWWDWTNIDFTHVNVVHVCGEGEHAREVAATEPLCPGVWEEHALVCPPSPLARTITIGEVTPMRIYCLLQVIIICSNLCSKPNYIEYTPQPPPSPHCWRTGISRPVVLLPGFVTMVMLNPHTLCIWYVECLERKFVWYFSYMIGWF